MYAHICVKLNLKSEFKDNIVFISSTYFGSCPHTAPDVKP